MQAVRSMMNRLKLTVNEAKTSICRIPDESFDFLGYTICRCQSVKTGKAYIWTRPSKKKIALICRAITELIGRRWVLEDAQDRVGRLNRLMIGWANYFCLGPVSKAYQAVNAHARYGLRRWLCRKNKVPGAGTSLFPDEFLYDKLGLVRLDLRTRNFPWAKA
jgi:hypothetical protein